MWSTENFLYHRALTCKSLVRVEIKLKREREREREREIEESEREGWGGRELGGV